MNTKHKCTIIVFVLVLNIIGMMFGGTNLLKGVSFGTAEAQSFLIRPTHPRIWITDDCDLNGDGDFNDPNEQGNLDDLKASFLSGDKQTKYANLKGFADNYIGQLDTIEALSIIVLEGEMQAPPEWAVQELDALDTLQTCYDAFIDKFVFDDGSTVATNFSGGNIDDILEGFLDWRKFALIRGSEHLQTTLIKVWKYYYQYGVDRGWFVDGFYNGGYDMEHAGEMFPVLWGNLEIDPNDPELIQTNQEFANLLKSAKMFNSNSGLFRNAIVYGGDSTPWVVKGDVSLNLQYIIPAWLAYLTTGDVSYKNWAIQYADGWAEMAQRNSGIIPYHVDDDTQEIGPMEGGRWYSGPAIHSDLKRWAYDGQYGFTIFSRALQSYPMALVYMDGGNSSHLEPFKTTIDAIFNSRTDGLPSLRYTEANGWTRDIYAAWFPYLLDRLYALNFSVDAKNRILSYRAAATSDERAYLDRMNFIYFDSSNFNIPTSLISKSVKRNQQATDWIKTLYYTGGALPVDGDDLRKYAPWGDGLDWLNFLDGSLFVGFGGPNTGPVRYFQEDGSTGLPLGVAVLVTDVNQSSFRLLVYNDNTYDVKFMLTAGYYGQNRFNQVTVNREPIPISDKKVKVEVKAGTLAEAIFDITRYAYEPTLKPASIPETIPPNPPKDLTVQEFDYHKVKLSWTQPDQAEDGDIASSYNIYRLTTPGVTRETGENLGNTQNTSYIDSTVIPETTYYYVVTAIDDPENKNEGEESNEVTVTIPPDTVPPQAPTGLKAESGDSQVTLTWNGNTEEDLAGYKIYRSQTSGGAYSKVAETNKDTTTYQDKGLVNLIRYYYVITAYDKADLESGYSNEASTIPSPQQITLTFQEGDGGLYSDTEDTYISNYPANPPELNMNMGLSVGISAGIQGFRGTKTLIRFKDIIGSNQGQIPENSTIIEAKIELRTGPTVTNSPVTAYRVLEGWLEGNQIKSNIDAPGKYGATWNKAKDYFEGEGMDVPWSTIGCPANGVCAEAQPQDSQIPSIDHSWYAWDIAKAIQSWANGELNCGIILTNEGGIVGFYSSNDVNISYRPKLTVTYIPPQPKVPELTLTKSALVNNQPVSEAASGDTITYTITYQNTGQGDATKVIITDPIPAGTTYVQNSAAFISGPTGVIDQSTPTIKWTILSVPAGEGGSVGFEVRVE